MSVAASPSTDHEFDRLQRWYTPYRVEVILSRLPYNLDRGAVPDRGNDTRRPKRRARPDQWAERRAIEQADVLSAYVLLPWDERIAIHKHLIQGEDLQHVAKIMRCDPRTVARCVNRGVRAIAVALGWEDPAGVASEESPTVWRNPRLDA